MTNEINLGEYWYCLNKIAWWLVKNNKTFNTRNVYSYNDRVADYGTIIKVIKERGDNVELDGLIAEFVECAIYDNKTCLFYQLMLLVVIMKLNSTLILLYLWLIV